jgi:predicted lipoprotein with Yx(FWY)xxD motif
MRIRSYNRLAAAGLALLICPLRVSAAPVPKQLDASYPAEVALGEEGDKGFLFRRFPGAQRLYTYDRDRKNQSLCNAECEGPRPPVYTDCASKPMPDWTVVKRYSGLCQWAYQGHPLYTYFHDQPSDPQGDGEGGVWHLLGYIKP